MSTLPFIRSSKLCLTASLPEIELRFGVSGHSQTTIASRGMCATRRPEKSAFTSQVNLFHTLSPAKNSNEESMSLAAKKKKKRQPKARSKVTVSADALKSFPKTQPAGSPSL